MAPTISSLLDREDRTKTSGCLTLSSLYLDFVHGLSSAKFIKSHCLRKEFVESFKHCNDSLETSLLSVELAHCVYEA